MKLEYDINTATNIVTIKLDFTWPPNGGAATQKRCFKRVVPR
jgi:hypothetical protein